MPIILDFEACLKHAYHVKQDDEALLNDAGDPINTAAHGFNCYMERYVLPILEHHAPIDILIAHDDGADYRKTLFEGYKVKPASNAMQKEQIALMRDMVKRFWSAIGATQAKVSGVEADDIIAHFCEKLEGPILVYTVDADLLQLQGDYENTSVLLKCEFQEAGHHKGIPYEFTSLGKSMLGDTSDKYGGVKGFGPAKWKQLEEAYGHEGLRLLENCVATNDYADIVEELEDEENPALRMLYEKRQEWRLGYLLAKLHPELCWKPRGKKLTKIQWFKRLPNTQTVRKVFKAMGCSDLIEHDDIDKWLPLAWPVTAADVDDELFTDFEAECAKSPIVAFDYETHPSENALPTKPDGSDYVDVKEALIAGSSFTFGENLQYTIYIPVNPNSDGNVRVEVIGKLLKIAEKKSQLCAQNTFFELAVTLINLDFWLGDVVDTMLMQSYVDENESAGLKNMSKQVLGYDQATYIDTVTDPETGEARTMDQLSLDEVFHYGADDATCTAHIWVLYDIIMQLEGSKEFFMENETVSTHSLVSAYLTGCEQDWDALEAQHQKDLKTIEVNTETLTGLLTEHCSKVSEKRAKGLVAAEIDFIKGSARMKTKAKLEKANEKAGDDAIDLRSEEALTQISEAVQEAAKNFKVECLERSAYVPYTETFEEPEFLPTAGQFKALTEHLGFNPPLDKVSRKAINEWLATVRGMDVESEHDGRPELTQHQDDFTVLLAEAVDQLKAREGLEYNGLIAFCKCSTPAQGKKIASGDELNMGSSKQLQHLIYCKLGLPVRLRGFPDRGSTRDILGVEGAPQTDALAIETAMAEDTPEGDWRRGMLESLLAIKSAKTRISFYHTPYPLWKHPTDGRIHPQIRNCGTVTRRPTATAPNILAVSKHQEEGVMRSVYVPYDADAVIVSIDLKQQELMITASESGDVNLLSCYSGDNQRDVHSMTAAGIAKVPYADYEAVYKDAEHPKHDEYVTIRKRPAKQTNFLMTYLGEAPTLSRKLIIPLADAEKMMDSAYATYPRIQPWQAETIKFAQQHGYTQTAYGNRRHVSDAIFADKAGTRRRMERQCVNAVVQGCAADMLKVILTKCWRTNLWRDTGATLLGPVYDEITASVPVSSVVEYIGRLVKIMSLTPPGHAVPMVADVSLGRDWQKQIEIGVEPSEEVILEALEKARESM